MGKILNKVDDIRENVEDAIADLLAKIDKNKPLDEAEKAIITTGIKTGLCSLGFSLTDEQIQEIVDPIVEVGFSTPLICKRSEGANNETKSASLLSVRSERYLER